MFLFPNLVESHPFKSSLKAVVIAVVTLAGPVAVQAAEHTSTAPVEDTEETSDQLVREMQQVTQEFPMLAKRLGLIGIGDFRIPIACVGGVDPVCHANVQQACLSNTPPGQRPNYNFCLAQANSVCCRPAEFVRAD